jgi:hypothetical protein
MTIQHQIQRIEDLNRIEHGGRFYAEDELCEALWLVNIELRAGLPKRERMNANRQVAQFEELLSTLRSAGA